MDMWLDKVTALQKEKYDMLFANLLSSVLQSLGWFCYCIWTSIRSTVAQTQAIAGRLLEKSYPNLRAMLDSCIQNITSYSLISDGGQMFDHIVIFIVITGKMGFFYKAIVISAVAKTADNISDDFFTIIEELS